jgi:hypothetical protein
MSLYDEINGSSASVLDSQRLAMPEINAPSDFAMPSLSGPDRASIKPPSVTAGYIGAMQGGLQAGQASGAGQAYDATEAGVAMGSSIAAGALAGGLAGSVVPGIGTAAGAAVGAGVAALTSGAQAWMSLRAKKRRRRELESLKAEAMQREERLRAETAADKAYERKQNALAGAAEAYERNAQNMYKMIAGNKEALRFFVRDGV